MAPETLTNVQLTLTCGNAKCAKVITNPVMSGESAAHARQMMKTQQVECPHCGKVGRNKVASELTDAAITDAGYKAVAPDRPRRDRGGAQRKSSTPMARSARRQATRAAGKTAVPPMSDRQRDKLKRRGQDAGVLAKDSRSEPERKTDNRSSGATPQPGPDGAKPPSTRGSDKPVETRPKKDKKAKAAKGDK